MKRKIIIAAAVLIAAAAAVCLLVFKSDAFKGEWVKNPDRYYLSFTLMNEDDSSVMPLRAGDTICASWSIEKGRVSVEISSESGEMLYRGSDIDTAEFELPISQDGNYIFSVSARNAAGYMEFIIK